MCNDLQSLCQLLRKGAAFCRIMTLKCCLFYVDASLFSET